MRLGQVGQATNGLDVFGPTLAYEQRAFWILLQVVGVLGDAADQDQRPAELVQAVRNHGTERETRH
ncbi:hypothetical protein D3C76_1761380 [compost metagenome]